MPLSFVREHHGNHHSTNFRATKTFSNFKMPQICCFKFNNSVYMVNFYYTGNGKLISMFSKDVALGPLLFTGAQFNCS